MDTASTLMGLGLLILFIAPVGYLVYNQSHKEKKRAKKMAFLASKKGYNLDETENTHGLSIGLDKTAGKFLLLRSAEKADLQEIDLKDLMKIEIIKIDEDEKNTQALDEIREISLLLKSKSNEDKRLIFYAEEEDPVTEKNNRLDRAIKWQKALQKYCKS
ncbi:hypothetical protein OQ279_15205 [Salinimicrobium sp. MT39]|uniref:Uncharacterized protein n=1 Tax=Salinimicrobium profundisediminis TaxID=2994553 RepID=A0A9X3I2C8_9FLAO|nr:hypothetical protein [Salinimicrobium profundisediminis]MCX2839494.1 hypothetical protein [Salinimicrobium profundisediminis]